MNRRNLLSYTSLGAVGLLAAGCSSLFSSSGGLTSTVQADISAAQAVISAINSAVSTFTANASNVIGTAAATTIASIQNYVTQAQSMITTVVQTLSSSSFNASQLASWLAVAIQLLTGLVSVAASPVGVGSPFDNQVNNANQAYNNFRKVAGL